MPNEKCHFPSEHDLIRYESATDFFFNIMDWNDEYLYRVLILQRPIRIEIMI
jgi:hypothetical protein